MTVSLLIYATSGLIKDKCSYTITIMMCAKFDHDTLNSVSLQYSEGLHHRDTLIFV